MTDTWTQIEAATAFLREQCDLSPEIGLILGTGLGKLAEKIDTNIRELEGAVTKVLGYAGLSGQAVTKDLVRQCLRELFRARKGQSSIEDIMGVVTEHFGVKL